MANTITAKDAREYALTIAAGHAYKDHVDNKEFDHQLTVEEFARLIEHAILNSTKSKPLRHGRYGFWSKSDNLIVVVDPRSPDGGTAYVPDNALERFRRLN